VIAYIVASPARLLAAVLAAWGIGCGFLGYAAGRINRGRECLSCGRPFQGGVCRPAREARAARPGPLPRRAPGQPHPAAYLAHWRVRHCGCQESLAPPRLIPCPSHASQQAEILRLLGIEAAETRKARRP
jgi:hypothetical protein